MRLYIDGAWFKDEHGRTVHLRGVNLGGSNKVPVQPPGATHIREGFFEHENISFVGRPFPLEDADEHFERLRHWGMRLIRLPITWEAIEHAGPGVYDEAFLDYIAAIVEKAGEYDMKVFIDAHQDVWSRFSGGDGAPGWTLEKVGLDMQSFHLNGAALTHQMHGDPFPRMIWASNYSKLAASTMFTLFFAGNDFAPQTMIDDVPVQEFLQTHYINAFKQVALRVRDMPHVIGYDAINEPFHGFIGVKDLNGLHSNIRIGAMPTPIQSMALGHGISQDVADWQITPLGPR
ncbi:MAG: cellulase family glycosylhydrolase, partial [Aggregatilineales bacterium]